MSCIFKHCAKMETSSPPNFPQEKTGQVLFLIFPLSGSLKINVGIIYLVLNVDVE